MPLVTLAVAALAAGLVGSSSAAAQAPEPSPSVPVIVVTGEAIVQRAPDRALVAVAVESRARNPRDAQAQNAQAMTAVQQRIAAARIPREAVRTIGYDLVQEFDYADGRRTPRDFLARNSIEIRVDEIARTGELVDALVQGGATSISSIRFDVRDREAAEREALRLAVVDARQRAEAAAAGAGRTLDRVLRIEDVREPAPPVMPRPVMAVRAAEAQPPTPVEPGLVEIRGRVTLTVSMK